MIIHPKVRGFICVTSHPEGCAENVKKQVEYIKQSVPISNGPKCALIIGASTGYGLASRIAVAFGSQTSTLGVFMERPPVRNRPASAGWYNSAMFEKIANNHNIPSISINGDAFSQKIRNEAIETIKSKLGKIDLVIYSLASPRCFDEDKNLYQAAIKPIKRSFTSVTLDTDREVVKKIEIEEASRREIGDTIKVMGGENWEIWIDDLYEAKVLNRGVITIAYSYIGPKITWPIYNEGTIGKAKKDLENRSLNINKKLKNISGRSVISVNKAVVSQASSAIPVVPLYLSVLFKVMKSKDNHESCINQMYRLLSVKIYGKESSINGSNNRVRLDDWELSSEVQDEVMRIWPKVTTRNLRDTTDLAGYQSEFLNLFGFNFTGIDYMKNSNININIPSLKH